MEDKELTSQISPDRTFLLQNKLTTVNKCMEDLLLKLPRLMNTEIETNSHLDENVHRGHLKTLYGYLRLAGTSLTDNYDADEILLSKFFYLNLQNVSKLLQALVSCIQFDYKSLNNLYQISSDESDLQIMSNYSGLETYLADRTLFGQLSQICECLGRSDAAHLLIDELLTNELIFLQQNQYRCEVGKVFIW